MNAKTTKFLAVLAVLAMAFAGAAVLVQDQTSDADAAEATTAATYDADNKTTAGGISKIKLEDTDSKKAVIPYQPKVETTPATVIEPGYSYYVNADVEVNIPKEVKRDNPVVFFILDGAQVTFKLNNDGTLDGGLYFINVASEEDGVITLQKVRDGKDGSKALFDANGYAKAGAATEPDFFSYKAADYGITFDDSTTSLVAIAEKDAPGMFAVGDLDELNILSDTNITGKIATVNFKKDNIVASLTDFTGTLVYGTNSISLKDFTGAIKSVPAINTPKGSFAGLVAIICDAGEVTGTEALGLFVLDDGVSLTFAETATLGGAFGYVDEYNDMHFARGSTPMTVGMGGLTIYAGDNMIGFDGTLLLKENEDLQFTGNVTLSGMVYSNGKNLSLENITADPKDATKTMPVDIKLGTFQVTDSTAAPGSVTLKTSVLVEAGCSFYVSGEMIIGPEAPAQGDAPVVLKIAEGAVVKPEGKLTINSTGSIWNAGQFIATNYSVTTEATGNNATSTTTYFDKQLVRVFMNTSYQTGTFYLGSSIYDGTVSASATDGAQTPLTVAFGSYIDMTGIDKVNLTSGGINVNSPLYKYNTLILATFDNTIALTASYDNQYPVTVTLDGKASATPVMTAKSATFRNVVWQSPISATLYVTAPEVYTVVLAETITTDDPAKAATVWTEGLTITDQNGRVIPISSERGKEGYIEVVFGYEYTIQGANSTSNYKFISPNGELTDLTKVSKTKGTFTMIRNNVAKTDAGAEAPVVLQVTEGFATTLTVSLEDSDKKYAVGAVFMYYVLADEKGKAIGDGTPVVVQLDDHNDKVGVITGIYSNDTILFKSEFVQFYKSVALEAGKSNIIFPEEVPDDLSTDTDTPVAAVDTPIDSKKWSEGFTFVKPTGTDKTVAASFTLRCSPNTVDVVFVFGENTDPDQKITVDFTTVCSKMTHGDSYSKKMSETASSEPANQFTITMAVGEVYKVTWTERDGYLSSMVYTELPAASPVVNKDYVEGTPVTVAGALQYTLTAQQLIYITVENQTDYDLTLSIGKFSADIAKGKSNNKVIVNDDNKTLVLSKKGWTVEGWDFKIYKGQTTAASTVYVSGPQTTETYRTYNGNTEQITTTTNTITKIIITKASMEMTRYFVNVLADDHGAIDPFDQTGYMDEVRKAYVTTQYGYNVVDVIYQYKEIDDPEIVEGHATKGTTPEGQEVWTYTMPASNVLLKPIIEKETRELSFVDQNGELLAPVEKVAPRTEVFMPVPCWPLSEVIDVTTEAEIDFEVDANGYISFVMPDEDVVFVVTCQEIDYSKNVLVTIGQRGAAIALVITALDGKMIASGSITMYVNYTYEEDGEVWTDAVEVTVEYESDGHSHGVILDETFIEEIGEYYDGAFAVTGSYELGYAAGEMSKTVYTPVLGA